MSDILRVRWTITPKTAPQPWIACSGCGKLNAFRSSGKVRLNANGRKLDAWLIYKCLTCDKTWNRSIFERQNVREIDPRILEALHSNDPQWIWAEAFNMQALRRKSQRVDEFPEYDVAKAVVHAAAFSRQSRSSCKLPFRSTCAWIVCWRPSLKSPARAFRCSVTEAQFG